MPKKGFGLQSDFFSCGQIVLELVTGDHPRDRYFEQNQLKKFDECKKSCNMALRVPTNIEAELKQLISSLTLIHQGCRAPARNALQLLNTKFFDNCDADVPTNLSKTEKLQYDGEVEEERVFDSFDHLSILTDDDEIEDGNVDQSKKQKLF